MKTFLVWLSTNATAIGLAGAAIAFAWSAIQFILSRRSELRSREFEHYHLLIKELVSPDSETKSTWIDRQVAVVFELRHFPRYYEPTVRILSGLKEQWSANPQSASSTRLFKEIEFTIEYIQRKNKTISSKLRKIGGRG